MEGSTIAYGIIHYSILQYILFSQGINIESHSLVDDHTVVQNIKPRYYLELQPIYFKIEIKSGFFGQNYQIKLWLKSL